MAADATYRICIVCSGNICRSPMAEVVLRELVERAGLSDVVEVDSAGTGDWHIGEQADTRALAALTAGGYDGSLHRARQFDPHWFARRDLILALDRGHLRALRSWASHEQDRRKVRLLRSFDPALDGADEADLDLADPYDHGDEVFTRPCTRSRPPARASWSTCARSSPAPRPVPAAGPRSESGPNGGRANCRAVRA